MKKNDLLEPSAGGLYCAAGDFWIDPLRPVPRAVITHAHADHARGGSEEYHTAESNRAILAARIGAGADDEHDDEHDENEDAGQRSDHHGHAWGEPFELGDTRVTLFPAGHILGSSWVRIESEQGTWGVSGDFKRAPDPTCEGFQPADCDVWVTECTFGLPVYRWPEPSEVIDEVDAWWDECRAASRPAVLFCYALGKAQRVLAELVVRRPAMRVWLHGAMRPLTEIYRAQGVPLPETLLVSEAEKGEKFAGELVLAPPSAAGSTWMRRFPKHSAGFVSGWMRIRGNRRRRGYDRGFVLSDHADWPALIATVGDQRARRVVTIHGNGEPLAGYLREQGLDAEAWNLRAGLSGGA